MGRKRPSIIRRDVIRRGAAAAFRVLGRRRGGGRIFRGGENAVAILVGALKLADGLRRPFLKRQRSVAVRVELGEGLLARIQQLVRLDPPVFVLVGAAETLLLAAFGGRLGRFQWRGSREQRRAGGARWRRTRQARAALGARLPDEEHPGEKQESRGWVGLQEISNPM